VASTSKSNADQELVEMQRALLSGPTVGVPHQERDPDAVRTFMDRRAAQHEAWGQFVADEDIFDPMGNALVFTAGMQVPVEHVEKWDLEATGKVKRVATADEARRGFVAPSVGPASLIGDAPAKPATSPSAK
jgi:hypothetical protein